MRIRRANLTGLGSLEKVTMFSSFQISYWRIGSSGRAGCSSQNFPSGP